MRRSTTVRLYYQSGAFALFSLYQAFISTCIHNSLEIEQPSVRPHIFKGFEIRSTFSPQSLISAHKKNEWSFSSSEKNSFNGDPSLFGVSLGPPAFVQMSLSSRSLHLLLSRALYYGFQNSCREQWTVQCSNFGHVQCVFKCCSGGNLNMPCCRLIREHVLINLVGS